MWFNVAIFIVFLTISKTPGSFKHLYLNQYRAEKYQNVS